MDIIRRKANTEYIVLQKAASQTGYASDYIGWLIRKGKIKGKKVYTGASWQIEKEELIKYCQKHKSLDLRDFYFLKKKYSEKKYLSLKEAAEISGYASDYIGWLIRKGKIKGKKIYTAISWQTTEQAIKNYQERKTKTKEKISFNFPSYITYIKSIHLIPESGNKVFGFGWRLSLITLIIFFLFSGLAPIKFLHSSLISAITAGETKTINYYSFVSYGDWQNPENVPGLPEVGPAGDINSFNENNSAVYQTGPLQLIIEGFVAFEAEEIEEREEAEEIEEMEETEEVEDLEEAEEVTEEETAEAEEVINGEEIIDEEVEDLTEVEEAEGAEEVGEVEEMEEAEEIEEIELMEEVEDEEEGIEVESEETGFLKRMKDFFGLKVLAQENTFSAKIKLSFAIGEKESDIQIIEEQEIEPAPSDSEPTGFWNKVKNFLIVKAEEGQIENGSLPAEEMLSHLDTRIIIWWSLACPEPVEEDGENGSTCSPQGWQILDTISNYPLSNALNGGYFEYEAPFLNNFEDVENLKIKFEGVVGGETKITAFLDSVWIEVEYQEKEEEEEYELIAIKKDWRADEEPEFEIVSKKEKNIVEKLVAAIGTVFEEEPKVGATLIRPDKKLVLQAGEDFSAKTRSPTKIKIFKTEDFRPGLHTLKVDFEKNGKVYNLEQDFTWGVLAINVNKSIYTLADEQAYLQFGVLDDRGHTICDADLELKITPPNYGSSTSIDVERSGECGPNNVTNVPDYFAYYQLPGEVGVYELELTAHTKNGTRTITDSFEVKEAVPFDVERIGPTRIYPPATYEMKMIVKVNQDFVGEVVETVPATFEIIQCSECLTSEVKHLLNSEIIWQADWQAGETHELKYQFNAPDISPYLYLLGPLEFYE